MDTQNSKLKTQNSIQRASRTVSALNRFLRACRKEKVDRPPVWVMRQAGRYLPEYRKIRQKAGDFLTMCYTPSIAAEVTLQPIRRFGLDAAIVFSDILTPLVPMGADLTFSPAPHISNPIRLPGDLERFRVPDPWGGTEFLSETLERVRSNLDDDTALIGFCGAPWTLASYLVEGGTSKSFTRVKSFALHNPEDFDRLVVGNILNKITQFSSFRIMILPDHLTPLSLRTHTSEPVPLAIFPWNEKKSADKITEQKKKFNEKDAQRGMLLPDGHKLMEFFLQRREE